MQEQWPLSLLIDRQHAKLDEDFWSLASMHLRCRLRFLYLLTNLGAFKTSRIRSKEVVDLMVLIVMCVPTPDIILD